MKNIEKVVKVLNDALKADPNAIHALLCNRVPCNRELVDHPTIVVESNPVMFDKNLYTVGMLGVLNGVIKPLTGKRIAAKFYDKTNQLVGFEVWKG